MRNGFWMVYVGIGMFVLIAGLREVEHALDRVRDSDDHWRIEAGTQPLPDVVWTLLALIMVVGIVFGWPAGVAILAGGRRPRS